MITTLFIAMMSLIVFFTTVRLGLSLMMRIVKAFEGITAVALLLFFMAVWSDPGGTGLLFRKLFFAISEVITNFSSA